MIRSLYRRLSSSLTRSQFIRTMFTLFANRRRTTVLALFVLAAITLGGYAAGASSSANTSRWQQLASHYESLTKIFASEETPSAAPALRTMGSSAVSMLAPAAVTLSWNTFGNAGTETTEPSTANDPNISSTNLTLGAGITAAANGNRFGGSGWFDTGNTAAGNTLAEAIAGNNYIQFIVTPNSGFSFTPTSLVFTWDRSATGPSNVALRSSADSFSTNLGSVTGIVASAFASNTITISGLTNLTTATTFRLYGYGATATAGTGGFDTNTNANNVILNGTTASTSPAITVTGGPLNFGDRVVGATSPEQTYTVAGSNLTADITVTAPSTDFQVSKTSGSGFGSSVTFTQSGGTVTTQTVYVRFTPQSAGAKSGNVANASTGATTQNVAVSGTGVACPSLFTVDDTLDTPDANPGDGVCDDGSTDHLCTLRAAVMEANALAATACSPLTIDFSVTGTITLTNGQLLITHPNLTISGPGASQLTVSGNNASRVFEINTASMTGISGLTITGGNGVGATESGSGGGIYSKGKLTLTGCVVTGNTTTGPTIHEGGGVFNAGTQLLTLTNCTISNNTANFGGAGVISFGNLVMTGCTVANNTNTYTSDSGRGGGVETYATTTITNSTITGNHIDNGTGDNAGGLWNCCGPLTIINSTITGNSAAGNSGAPSAGGVLQDSCCGGSVTVLNSIIAGNTGTGGAVADVGGTFISSGFNLIGDGTGATGFTGTGDQVGTTATPINALLSLLGNYGGLTQTHALLPGSPAINAGTSSGAPTTDQRAKSRLGTTDIGAFESQGFVLTATGGDGQSTTVNTNFANPLTLTVAANNTADGEPVNGGRITFTPPGSGASCTFASNPATISGLAASSGTVTANGTAGSYNVTANATGVDSPATFALTNTPANTAPSFATVATPSRQQGSPASNSTIATVTDAETSAGSLTVTVTSANPSNGVTISNIQNSGGTITADIIADCTASNASFTLQVSDGSLTGTGMLNVTVTANDSPTVGTYANQSVLSGNNVTVTPSVAPADNGSIAGVTATASPNTFTGSFSGNTTTGAVTITNAAPAGTYTITVTVTDNCNATVQKTFTLTVNACPTLLTVNNLGDASDANAGDGICATSGSVCTLRAAIEEANAVTTCSPLTINFSVTGIIDLATVLPDIAHPNLTINGPGASQLTVRRSTAGGTPDFRIFAINSGKTVNMSGLTLSNGKTSAGQDGGALINSGTLGLSGMVFSGNTAGQSGGAIRSVGALTLSNSTISGNTAQFDAGVLISFSSATITNTTISGNTATSGQSGALKNENSTVTLTNCTVSGNNSDAFINLATSGNTASITLTNCTVTDGDLFNVDNGGATSAVINLKNTLVSHTSTTLVVAGANASIVSQGNNLTSDSGGGFLTGTGDLTNKNTLLAALGNYGGTTQTRALLPGSPAINAGTNTGAPATDQRGSSRVGATDIGAFESQGFTLAATSGGGQSTIVNTNFALPLKVTVTASGSEPVDGGTVTFTPPGSGASATVAGSPVTIAGSMATTGTVTANSITGSYNVAASATGATSINFALTNTCQTITVTNPATTTGTQFSAFSQTFTQTGGIGTTTFSTASALPNGLTLSSAGVLSGTPTQIGTFPITVKATDSNNCMGTGATYTLVINSAGCVTSLTVNNIGDDGDATPGNGVCETATGNGICTLRAAIEEANALTACTPFTINFSVTGTINLASELPYLEHPDLTIQGPGATQLTVTRNVAAQFGIFTVVSDVAVINDLTVSNGNSTDLAGGIYGDKNLTINRCHITGNTAARGGGVVSEGGTLSINNSTISGNTATSEGGGVFGWGNEGTSQITLTNCTISGNSVTAAGGAATAGGLAAYAEVGGTSVINLVNCTITGNAATNAANAGGIFSGVEDSGSTANINLKNTILAGNGSTQALAGANATITSQGNNLASDNAGGFLTGTGDLTNTNPLLAALGSYGGATQTHALLPGSPAINAGTSSGAPTSDQRGSARVGNVDIGAFESQGFVLALSGGSPQTALLNASFANPLAVTVTANNASEPVNGGQVIFTPPGSGATATLTTSPATIASGAASVTATADGTAGSYNVAATANGATPTVNFALTNNIAPTVTQLQRGNSSPRNTATLTFNVIFSEPVTSASASNFTLVPGGGLTGASITNVVCNMAGQSCVVTVNTGTGSGTLGLNMTSSTGVTDSGGAGLSNLPFTGEVYTIDKDAPDTMITPPTPANPTNNTSATFTFTGSDTGGSGVVGFECKLDSGSFTACTSGQNYSALTDGSHAFQVRAIDAVGNVDDTPATYTWLVDTLAPDTTITANPPNPTNSFNASFSFTGNDGSGSGVFGFECKLDAGSFTACTSPQPYSGLTDGSHTFQVRAIDNVGNVDATPASYTWTIDTTPPPAPIVVAPPNGSTTSNPKPPVTGTAEPNSTVTVFIDGAAIGTAPVDSFGNWSFTPSSNLSNGAHTTKARAADAAGNVSVDSNTNTFIVDTAAPDTIITNNPASVTNSPTASFSFTGNDGSGSGVASFECKLGAGSFTACTSPQSYPGLADGSYTFQVRAIDNAGNMDATPASYTWTVDTIAPTVTINQAPGQADPTSTSPINFTLVFSEAVTGVGAGDVQLSGSAGANAFTITEIAPNNGTTYNVAVTGMSTGGTVVAIYLANSAQDAATNFNTASTSTDNTVTYTTFVCPTTLTVNDLGHTPDANVGDGFCKDAANKCTLRAAIEEANAITACSPLTINFSVTGTITLGSALASIAHPSLTITGPGADQLTVSGNNSVRVMQIGAGNYNVTISGLTMANGRNAFSFGPTGNGGAGLRNNSTGTVSIVNMVFSGNQGVDVTGGGIQHNSSGILNVTGSTFSNNSALNGGGLDNISTGTVNITNSTFHGNTASMGGGLRNGGGVSPAQMNILNCTVSGNTTNDSDGGGIKSQSGTTTSIKNTIVAGNNGTAKPDVAGAFTSQGFNLIGNTTGGTGFGGTDLLNVNPLLSALGNYGGTTPTLLLQPGSPAIDKGGAGVTTDQRGQSRPFDFPGVTNAANGNGSDIGAVEVQCASITLFSLSNLTVGGAFVVNSFAGGGTAPYTLSLTGGALPPGVNISGNSMSGTPTSAGTYSFTLTATDAYGCTGSQSYTVSVTCPTITLSPASLPAATVNAAYPQTITASPALAYAFSVTNGALPAGLTLNGDGTFSGAPTNSGTFNFRVTAGFGGCSTFADYTLLVNCPTVTLAPASLPNGTLGTAYNQTVAASPAGSYFYSVTSGALPTGLTLSGSTGAITGTPVIAGTFNFTVTAAAGACGTSRSYTVTVACQSVSITSTTTLTATAGSAYSHTINVTPAGNYTFVMTQGNLPSGLTLNPVTGVISGLPTVVGTVSFKIGVQLPNSCVSEQSYTMNVTCPPVVTVAPTTLPIGTTGVAYNQTLSASPAGGNYIYAVSAGSLPTGLNLNPATGSLSGTPGANGTFNFTITATGFGSCSGSRAYTIVIGGGGCQTISLPASLPVGSVGQLYSNSVAASPAGSYSYTSTGSLPPGVSLYGSFGLLLGYPTTNGTYNFSVTATDANNCAATQSYSVVIGAGSSQATVNDFSGDRRSDFALWREAQTQWLIVDSASGAAQIAQWGQTGDRPVTGDFDGDGKADLAGFGKDGHWRVKLSGGGTVDKVWGLGSDVPVAGDYDGDGKTDLAVWRGAETNWFILRSSDGQTQIMAWGSSLAPYNDLAVPGDYDGDGKTDIAVFRQANGHWYIRRSSDGKVVDKAWGLGTDVPVPADFDGDGKTDIAVWRGSEGNWYIVQSSTGATETKFWGAGYAPYLDTPAVGDYDGDGKADPTVWRKSDNRWYVLQSSDGATRTVAQGRAGDAPVTAQPKP